MADFTKYIGKYQRHSYKNYDKFLWELGVMQPRRKVVMMSTNYFEVDYDPQSETWLFTFSAILKNIKLKFKLGIEFEEETVDGREVRTIATKLGNTFVFLQTPKIFGEKSVNLTLEFTRRDCLLTSYVIGSNLRDYVHRQLFIKKLDPPYSRLQPWMMGV